MAGSASLLGSAFASTSATTIDVSVTLTVGRKYAIGVIGADVGSTVTAADTLSNSYTHRGSVVEAAIARRHHGLTCAPTTGGSTTITITYPSSADNRQVYVWELTDVGDYDAFGTATDTGNNPTTAATATNSAQPAFLLATCMDYQGGTPGVGTIGGASGVDEGTLFVGSGMLIGRGESQSVTSVGSQSANFTNSSFSRTTTLLWIFLESAPPTISAQPTDQTANAGATATFSVTATGGAAPYTYQWQDDSGGSFANISGATSSSYVTAAATYSMQSRRYRCVVTGANSLAVTSDAAYLRVAFNLTGTGPRAYPVLGGVIGAGSVESWLRGGASSGSSFEHIASGGFSFSGAAAAEQARNFTFGPSGGLTLSGAASAVEANDYAATASGGFSFAGAADAQIDIGFTFNGSGGITLGGTASAAEANDYTHAATGGITLAGAATVAEANDYTASASGGIVLAGAAAATLDVGFTVTGSGGITFAGSAIAEEANDYAVTSSGGFLFGGEATVEGPPPPGGTADAGRSFWIRRRGR